jgi:hypothetical protein
MLYLTAESAECLSLRISDIIEYSPTRDAFIRAIGAHNVATLSEMAELHLYDFGIFIELLPDEEEKAILENNIQMALAQKLIDLDDAIDIRDTRNVKLANQLLKIKRKKKLERDQIIQQQNIQAQSQANTAAAQEAAKIKMEQDNAMYENQVGLEKTKSSLKMRYLEQEARVKKELMMLEFELNTDVKKEEREIASRLESIREDRKDQRINMQADRQSQMIEQRKGGESLKKFESSGNDILTGGANLERFES